MNRDAIRLRFLRALATALCLAALAGCGGGASTSENPPTAPPPPAGYTGPPPASQDVQAFKLNVWDNLQASNRCGQCHGTGGQAPRFVRNDDINLAYEAANSVVDLANPVDSEMVTKVGGGHNCWLGSDSACADQLTVWIRNWAGQTLGGTRGAPLQPPPLRDVGSSRSFPADSGLFASTVYPVLEEYCSRCHSSAALTPQSPFFAEADVDVAYAAVRAKIDLDTPARSRLVVRLRDEFHNCWTDCGTAANVMQAAIQDFADGVPLTQVDPDLVISKALTLYDGTVASGGSRFDNAAIALYEFKTGTGTVAYDTSGVEPAANLTLSGAVTWVGGWGIDLRGGKAQGTTASSRKLHDLVKATSEYTIEAWVAPANVVQEMAYIVSYSGGTTARNFTLGQTMYDYDFLSRATTTGANGDPALSTPSADEVLQATLQHVVATYSPVDGRRIYVNGTLATQADPVPAGLFTDWNDTFALVLGNEVSNDRTWQGVIRMVAIHNRALTQPQIQQNFDAGVGERFYLLFSVAHLVNVPQSYVMFEASQFDSYSYLFDKPTFISLDRDQDPDQIRIRGVRIGINGAEARVGQAYAPLDRTVRAAGYDRHGRPARQGPVRGRVLPELRADRFEQQSVRRTGSGSAAAAPGRRSLIGGRAADLRGDLGLDVGHDRRAGEQPERRRDLPARARAAADGREHRGLPLLAPGRRGPARDRVLQRARGRRRRPRRLLPGVQLRGARGDGLRHGGRARAGHGPAGRARGRHGSRDPAGFRGDHGRSGRADRTAHGLRCGLRRRPHRSRRQGGLLGGHRQRQHAAAMRCLQR
jgi:hypothetical protein